MHQESNKQQDISLQQRHNIWIKNSWYLYDKLVVHKMAWPSLTFQWLPTVNQDKNGTRYQVLTATHKSGAVQASNNSQDHIQSKQQYIYIQQVFDGQCKVMIPYSKDMRNQMDIQQSEENRQASQVHIKEKFVNKSQANRARYSQRNPQLIAVKVDFGPIYIYKRGKQKNQNILQKQKFSEGFALQWSSNGLITGDHQGKIALWPNIQYEPYRFKYEDKIQDTKTITENTFVSVGDDGMLCIWDTKTSKIQQKVLAQIGPNRQLYSASVNSVNKSLILTGGQSGIIRLWDTRKLSQKLYKFQSHQAEVLNVQWSPVNPTIFASGSKDSKVKIWDLLRVGFEIPKDNSGTDQLLFTHEGHRDDILDLGWNLHQMLLGSTEEKYNTLQIYQIGNCLQNFQYIEDIEFLRQQCLS